MSLVRLVIDSNGTAADFKSQCNLAPGGLVAANNFGSYVSGLAAGALMGADLAFKVGAVQAAGTIAFTSTGAANAQTATILGVTWTALTSGHVVGEATFDRHNTLSIASANLALAINQYTAYTGIITATAGATGVTLTCVVPGLVGNGLKMVNVNWANTTITSFTSGTDGTAYNISLGG